MTTICACAICNTSERIPARPDRLAETPTRRDMRLVAVAWVEHRAADRRRRPRTWSRSTRFAAGRVVLASARLNSGGRVRIALASEACPKPTNRLMNASCQRLAAVADADKIAGADDELLDRLRHRLDRRIAFAVGPNRGRSRRAIWQSRRSTLDNRHCKEAQAPQLDFAAVVHAERAAAVAQSARTKERWRRLANEPSRRRAPCGGTPTSTCRRRSSRLAASSNRRISRCAA